MRYTTLPKNLILNSKLPSETPEQNWQGASMGGFAYCRLEKEVTEPVAPVPREATPGAAACFDLPPEQTPPPSQLQQDSPLAGGTSSRLAEGLNFEICVVVLI